MKPVSKLFFYDEKIDPAMIPAGADFLHVATSDFPVYISYLFFEPPHCDALVKRLISRGPGKELTTTGGNMQRERKTLDLQLSDGEKAFFYQRLGTEKPAIADFFGLNITASEDINGLGYPPGGEYHPHCDNSAPVFDQQGRMTGFDLNMPSRTLSTILFLTESVDELTGYNQCIGGNLSFNRLIDQDGEQLLVMPRKGMFVAFPSNPYYQHQVHPVYEGFRVALVDWHSAKRI